MDDDYEFDLEQYAQHSIVQTAPTVQPAKPKESKKPTEHYIKHLPVKWWLRVLALQKKHRKSNIVDLASAIIYLNGMKYNHGLDLACLKKFNISRSGSRRNLQLLEEAGLVVVEKMTRKNKPPVVIPLFDSEDIGEGEKDV